MYTILIALVKASAVAAAVEGPAHRLATSPTAVCHASLVTRLAVTTALPVSAVKTRAPCRIKVKLQIEAIAVSVTTPLFKKYGFIIISFYV